jgi:hypothetical protein
VADVTKSVRCGVSRTESMHDRVRARKPQCIVAASY